MTKRNSKGISLRMRATEFQAIKGACKALSTPETDVSPSQLFLAAAIGEAALLGFTTTTFEERSIRRLGKWPYVPERPDEDTLTERTSITVHPLELRTIEQAAESVGVSLTEFLIGSALHFIRVRQKLEPKNRALRAIELPPQYQD